jgi:hypothetical protein
MSLSINRARVAPFEEIEWKDIEVATKTVGWHVPEEHVQVLADPSNMART